MTDQFLQLIVSQAWQIAALASVVAVVNRTVAKNRPHLAHALWMLVLIKCVTPPIWGHSLGLFSQLQAMWKADPVIRQDLSSDEPLLMPHHNTDDEIAHVPPADDSPLPGLIAMNDSEVASTSIVPISLPTRTANLSFVLEAKPWKPSWPMILLSLVASGALLTISIMVARCVLCLRHIQRHRTTEFDESLSEQLHRLSKKLRLRRVPRIIVSDVLFGPAVIGLWRHVIVLPRCLIKSSRSCLPGRTFAPRRTVVPPQAEQRQGEGSSTNAAAAPTIRSCSQVAASREVLPGREDLLFLDPILAHELLHIRRGDLRTGTLQAIVQSLWWFHPAVWLCNGWLSREAERCCDEQVIAELGCSPAQYARSLLSVIESKHALQPIPVFPGMKPVEITSQRMERIMSLKSNLKKQTPLWCWLAVAVLAVVVLPGAVARTAADELKSLQAGPKEPASTTTSTSTAEQPIDNSDAKVDPLQSVNLLPLTSDRLFEATVSLNLKDRSLFPIVEMLAKEHHFSTSWNIPSNEESLFRSIEYSCQQLPLRDALKEIVEKAGCQLTINQFTVEIHCPEGNSGSTIKSMDRLTNERSPEWAMKQIRWNDTLMVSPNQIPTGETVIAWVNDVPVRVNDVVSTERQPSGQRVIRALYNRVGRYLAQEVLLQSSELTPAETSVGTASKAVGDTFEVSMLSQLVTETREQVIRRLLSTDQHTPWQIMSGIEGLRRDMLLKNGDTTVNALEWIQAGPMYQGEPWFEKTEHGGRAHPYSKPYWFEGHVNQFLSKFAACQLPLHATFGTPDGPITIQDMINHAKMVVNDKEAVSWTLLALCRYLPPDAKWTNAKGEEWSIERLVDIEASRPVGGPTSPNGGTDGLYALAVARNEYLKTRKPLEGVWLKADEKIKKYIDLARSQQNPDGTLSSDFFRSGQRKENFNRRLSSTSHLLQFLMHAVSDEQLKEDWIRRAVEATATDIQVHRKEFVACDPLFTATEALTTYLERTQGISLGLVASPLPMNVVSRETSAFETVASSNDQPSQLPKVLIGPVPKQNENGATLQKLPMPLTLVTYPVGDLVIPVNSGDKKPDYASITELIKATIEPDSWHDGAAIEVVRDTLTLVIRQTPRIHEQIKAFLQEVRKETPQIQVSCRLMKITTDEQRKGVQERCSMHPLNDHKSWALLTKSRSDEVIRFLTDKHTHVLMCPNITTYSGMTATIQIDPEETGDRWLRSLGLGQGTTTPLFHGCAIGVEPRIIGDSSVIRLKHSVYLNLKSAAENHSGPLTGNEGTSPLSVDESLVSSGQTLLLLIDTTKVNAEDAALDSTSDQQNSARGRYVVMLTVERLEEEEEPANRSLSK
jgi:beta-lactamase regulating signal transducer with metallopeptidase domain